MSPRRAEQHVALSLQMAARNFSRAEDALASARADRATEIVEAHEWGMTDERIAQFVGLSAARVKAIWKAETREPASR